MPIKRAKRIADQVWIGVAIREEMEIPWPRHEPIDVPIRPNERDDVIGRIVPDIVQKYVCFFIAETTADGVRLQAKAKEFTPVIELPGPLAKGDTIGV
jgi:hypothetical protein